MAYSPIKPHADLPAVSSHSLSLGRTPSPHLADLSFAPLSLSFDELHDDGPGEADRGTRSEQTGSKVSKILSSLTSSSRQSYDLVEADDYEVTDQTTPTLERHPNTIMAAATESPSMNRPSEQPPIRTASISRKLPLNHPMPGLQSLQGAYVRNVERLEETAQRLNMRSSLEEELHRMKMEQRQRERTMSGSSQANSVGSGPQRRISTRSVSDSIVDINTGVSRDGYTSIVPPHSAQVASMRSVSKSSRFSHTLPEPEFEGRPLDLELSYSRTQDVDALDPRLVRSPSPSNVSQDDRPPTAGSGDTFQQANTLFTDFDGVHFASDRNTRASRRISLTRPPRARDSRAFKEPQPGEEMIYYPAPVPVMLNLPMRLSRMNWSEQEKKRIQTFANITDDKRKSAAMVLGEEKLPGQNKRQSTLPPQLRASAFFDHRGMSPDVQLKDGSAVATLDSILDAAAHAPVSAFTDHPIAGHLGNDFYSAEKSPRKSTQLLKEKKAKRKSSFSNLLKSKRSSGNLSEVAGRESRMSSTMLARSENGEVEHHDNPEKSIAPGSDEISDDEDQRDHEREHEAKDDGDDGESGTESETSEAEFQPGFSTAPTTLLAELQMRKAQQKSRNRTAVNAFPNGMHSTLLELDTVTQLQQKSRRQKHVKLAWEDEDAVDRENFDDDDVPLGMLFPEKEQQTHVNHNRPLGLMEKKELEENEPLSHRRARLRGEPIEQPLRSPGLDHREEEAPKPMLELPDLAGPDDEEEEGESLAQRRQRMKIRKEHGASADFARQVSSELGLKVEAKKTPDVEETLGQRRKRLQAEALKNGDRSVSGQDGGSRPVLQTKRSLADVLRANPIGYVDPNESKTARLAMATQERAREREAQFLAAQEADRQQAFATRNRFGLGNESGLIQAPSQHFQGYQQPHAAISNGYNLGTNVAPGFPTAFGYPSTTSLPMQPGYVNPLMGMMNPQPNYAYQPQMIPGYGYASAMELNGMGPPLDPKQRARIEGWRQGVL